MKTSFVTWVTHGIKRGRFEWDRRKAGYALLAMVGVTLVAAAYLLLVSHTTAQGRHIERLRSELLRLEAQNEMLEEQIARESAVAVMTARATALGYVPVVVGQAEYLEVPSEASPTPGVAATATLSP